MEDYTLLIDLHKPMKRQGPGSDSDTKRAVELAGLNPSEPLRLLDIGCGTGASSLLLAELLDVQVTAVDFFPHFLEELQVRAVDLGLAGNIIPLVCTMESLPFTGEPYDVIWSEGAIYNMGFESGVNYWRQFLKPGGIIAVSEITWTTGSRPREVQQHWDTEYPGIGTASEKIGILERSGYSPIGYFTLPESSWLDNYYRPLQKSFSSFIDRHQGSLEAQAIVAAEENEIAVYERYKSYYSYGMYVAKKSS